MQQIRFLLICALASLLPASAPAQPAAPRSILVIDDANAKPVSDWRQAQLWNISESDLPPGSEISLFEPATWQQFRVQIAAIVVVILLQAGLIMLLLHEHHRRRKAEVETRQRMAELAHMNRFATAGEMSASIAHELAQPLTAIRINAETADRLISATSPELPQLKEILADIKRDDERASEVLRRLRSLLKKRPFDPQDMDLAETISEIFDFMLVPASARDVTLSCVPGALPLRVRGDRIQLQQVVLNLILNGMEALAANPIGQRWITGRIIRKDGAAEVSISDSGPGIPSNGLEQVFEPFFTTKNQGMGMGLSIARKIVEAHGGRIWAENGPDGAVFRMSLPLAKAG